MVDQWVEVSHSHSPLGSTSEPFYGNGSFQKLDGNTIFERIYLSDQLCYDNSGDILITSNPWRDSRDEIVTLTQCFVSKSVHNLKKTPKISILSLAVKLLIIHVHNNVQTCPLVLE